MYRLSLALLALTWSSLGTAAAGEAPASLDLAGAWQFRMDAEDAGIQAQWFAQRFSDTLTLPGSMQAQGFGNEVTSDTPWTGQVVDQSYFTDSRYAPYREPGNVKVPFWLQPKKHYVGAAWYQRTVTIPQAWQDKRVVLSLERCHWESRVWVDGRAMGSNNSLCTPHEYDLTQALAAPGEHVVTIRVDNRMLVDVGINAHSVSDHTQSNWNGIIGRMTLTATDRVWIDDIQVYPDIERKAARVQVRIGNATGGAGQGTLRVGASTSNAPQTPAVTASFSMEAEGTTIDVDLPMGGEALLWDEFSPALYRLEVTLTAETREMQHTGQRAVTFGMRSFSAKGTQFAVNQRPVFLRGTLECCIFPRTGYPPTDVASWKRVIAACKDYGLNHMRFHSWCPPEAAFAAADLSGFYLMVECPAWANVGRKPLQQFIRAEGDRILEAYGNHPSFCMLAYGNEPGGRRQKKFLGELVAYWKAKDGRRLYTSASGWPIIPENDFHSTPDPRIQAWGAGLKSRINALPPETQTDYRDFVGRYTVPIVSHEIGQWCVYPDFSEIPKYTGVLKAKNFEIFRDTLEANHMGDQAHDFLMASGKLQTLCYKEEIESALRTPGFGGFQLLDLHDFPGQGTALIGVLNPFWESKGYVSGPQYRRFCNATVPLARLAKRIFTAGEHFQASIEVTHFGTEPLKNTVAVWRLLDGEDKLIDSGRLSAQTVPLGNACTLGSAELDLPDLDAAMRCRLTVALENTPFENDWDVWVYPPAVDTKPPETVKIAHALDADTVTWLKKGGRVLLMPPQTAIRSDAVLGFSSIFWNTAWTRNQPPHTLGILCDPEHPALQGFPTEFHSNWQWWELLSRASAMTLDALPGGLRPIVQVIDTWFENRRLGLLFEAKVAGGQLLMCSMDLESDLDTRPVARQMRHGLLQYLASGRMRPAHSLSVEEVQALLKKAEEE